MALFEAGFKIRTLSLADALPGTWPKGIETRIGDITDASVVHEAMQGVDAVIHFAALLHIVNPPPNLQPEYERINVGGTSTVVEAARQAGVGRLVLFSTIAVYGNSANGILTEESPCNPDSFYAQTKLAAEGIVLSARRSDDRPLGTVLRLGAVYGARIKGNYRRLLLALAHGRFVPIGPGSNRRSLVYDKDVARAALLAVRHPDAAGRIFNVTDGRFHTMRTIIGSLCDALDRNLPRLVLPVGPIRRLAGFAEDGARVFGLSSPIVRATIDKYIEDVAVDSQRICAEIGFVPQYDLASGWRETVAEMRCSGEL
jgi:UDP-glucose 4-epimerase